LIVWGLYRSPYLAETVLWEAPLARGLAEPERTSSSGFVRAHHMWLECPWIGFLPPRLGRLPAMPEMLEAMVLLRLMDQGRVRGGHELRVLSHRSCGRHCISAAGRRSKILLYFSFKIVQFQRMIVLAD